MTAQAQLEADLRAQGHTTEATNVGGLPFVLLRGFTVQSGRFAGQVVDLGLQVMLNYPSELAPSIHVQAQPFLRPFGGDGSTFNVIASPLGPNWQYWSFNFTTIWQQGRGPSLTAIINGVMERA